MNGRCGNPLFGDRFVAVLLAGAMTAAVAGCGSDRLPVAPVQGKVLYRGEPLEFGSVMFQPDVGPAAKGTINSDGTFRLSSYGQADGAVIGTHRVRITCFDVQRPGHRHSQSEQEAGAGRPLIPRKYSNCATSGLQVEVEAANKPFVFELTD